VYKNKWVCAQEILHMTSYLYRCVHTHIYTLIYSHMAHTHVIYICAYIYECIPVYFCVCIYVRIYTCIQHECVHTYVSLRWEKSDQRKFMYTDICTHIYIYTYICTHQHIRRYIYIYVYLYVLFVHINICV